GSTHGRSDDARRSAGRRKRGAEPLSRVPAEGLYFGRRYAQMNGVNGILNYAPSTGVSFQPDWCPETRTPLGYALVLLAVIALRQRKALPWAGLLPRGGRP